MIGVIMNLKEYRNEIDEIDNQIIKLFEKRMGVVKNIAEYKLKNNIEILNDEREKQILEKIKDKSNKDYEKYVKQFFVNIMDISKQYQCKITKK